MARELYGYLRLGDNYIPICESYYGSGLPEFAKVKISDLPRYDNFITDLGISRLSVGSTTLNAGSSAKLQQIQRLFIDRNSVFEPLSEDTTTYVPFPFLILLDNSLTLYGRFYTAYGIDFYLQPFYVRDGSNNTVSDLTGYEELYISIGLNTYSSKTLTITFYTELPSFIRSDALQTTTGTNFTDSVRYPEYERYIKVYLEIPKPVDKLELSPQSPYISKDGEEQFTLIAFYEDGTYEDVTSKASWGLGVNTIDEPVSELLGYSITPNGLLSLAVPEANNIVVSAKYGGKGQYTTAFYYSYGDGTQGGVGGTGQTTGPGGSWGNGIGPAPSTDIRGDVPNGSSEANSSSIGLFTRYAMNGSDLFTLGSALYVENILANVGKEIMSFLWNSPNEALISLLSYPFDVTSIINTTPAGIKFGSLELDAVTGNRLNGTFAQIDWGTIQLSEYWGNFLDYAPHTKIELYLPWCTGSVSIDPHECLPGSISVKTNIEISKGTCVHNVIGNKGALIGTYSGTCGSQLPMTALDTSGKALALVTAAAGAIVAGAAAGGGASAAISAANSPHTTAMAYSLEQSRGLDPMSARVAAQREAMSIAEAPYRSIERRTQQAALVSSVAAFRTPASIQRNGSFTGNGAGMAIQFPFIIVSRPEQNIPNNYGRFFGFPSNVYATLRYVSGYTEVGSIHVNGLTGATLEEIEEVESLLKGGVIL